ncbi:MAG: LolA family protein [Nocardioidaceae bacterium]
MTHVFTPRRLRWGAPAVVAAAIAAAAITSTNAGASAQPKLPPRTAAQLLAAVEQAHPTGLSGTIVETANLGLPSLPDTPGGGGGGGLSPQALLSGSHTIRIWYAGPSQQRLAVLAPMSERDIIHNGSSLWTYTSTTNEVTHSTLPGSAEHKTSRSEAAVPTPQSAAEQALRAIDPTTKVKVDRTARVAGRPAYQLDLVPRDTRSLIGSVRIAVDSATSVPLRVQVFARGASSPAIQVGFTDVTFGTPNASVFQFVPPAGAKVTQQSLGSHQGEGPTKAQGAHHGNFMKPRQHAHAAGASSSPTTLGKGWTTVVELPAGQLGSNAQLLNQMSTPVAGGRLITTALLSVLITPDGHVFAGAVSGSALQHVAATGHGL